MSVVMLGPPGVASAASGAYGTIATIAGGTGANSASDAQRPAGIAADTNYLYVSDAAEDVVRRIDRVTGAETVIAGNGVAGSDGDGGPATAAMLQPRGLDVDIAGNVFVADIGGSRIRKIATNGTITTVAGNGSVGWSGDGGPATAARLSYPHDVDVDAAGNLYIADTANNAVRKVTAGGTISTIIGTGCTQWGCDAYPPSPTRLNQPMGVSVDTAGNVLVADTNNHRIQMLSGGGGSPTTVAGTGTPGFSGDGGPATSATFAYPTGIDVGAGGFLVADSMNNRIRRVLVGTIDTLLGSGAYGCSPSGTLPSTTSMTQPQAVVALPVSGLAVADTFCRRVRAMGAGGIMSIVAGNGRDAFSGDGGNAPAAQFSVPHGLSVDAAGNTYVADSGNHRVRKIAPDGTITTVAGGGTWASWCPTQYAQINYAYGCFGGFGGDGGPATSSKLAFPTDVAVAADGSLLIADTNNARVRRVSTGGTISTVAGNGTPTYSGDGGSATVAGLVDPESVAAAPGGGFFVADGAGHRIRKVDALGTISTVAGDGTPGSSGDGGPASAAQLDYPISIAVDPQGRLLIADLQYSSSTSRLRRIENGVITTIASVPDGNIRDVTTSSDGRVFVTVDLPAGPAVAEVLAGGVFGGIGGTGSSFGFSGDGGPAGGASLSQPRGLTVDNNHAIRFVDGDRVRIIHGVTAVAPQSPGGVTATAGKQSATVSWSAPTDDGGAPVISYEVTASPGGNVCHPSGASLSCTVSGLTGGVAYTFAVTATNAKGTGAPSPPSAPVTPWSGSTFHPVTPFRALDSRSGPGFVGAVNAGSPRALTVAGVGGIPANASGVVMNVTATGATMASYLTVYPAGTTPPGTASLLFGAGQTVPNLVTVGIGAGGRVSFANQQGSVHVVADVVGYYDDGQDPAGPGFVGAVPARLLDSRTTTGGWNGVKLGPDQARTVAVRGAAGVPNTAVAVVLNVTATGGTSSSYLQCYPTGVTRPGTTNVLFAAGQTVPNLVTVGIGADGAIAIYNQLGNVHVVADVVGYYGPGGSRFHAVAPTRLLDSRTSVGGWSSTPLGADSARSLVVTGGVIPTAATGLLANVTVTGGTASSYLSVSPNPGPAPAPTANLLFGAGQTVPNAVNVGIGNNRVDLYNQKGSVHTVVDAFGYFSPF